MKKTKQTWLNSYISLHRDKNRIAVKYLITFATNQNAITWTAKFRFFSPLVNESVKDIKYKRLPLEHVKFIYISKKDIPRIP